MGRKDGELKMKRGEKRTIKRKELGREEGHRKSKRTRKSLLQQSREKVKERTKRREGMNLKYKKTGEEWERRHDS